MAGCDGYVRKPKVTKPTVIGGAHIRGQWAKYDLIDGGRMS